MERSNCCSQTYRQTSCPIGLQTLKASDCGKRQVLAASLNSWLFYSKSICHRFAHPSACACGNAHRSVIANRSGLNQARVLMQLLWKYRIFRIHGFLNWSRISTRKFGIKVAIDSGRNQASFFGPFNNEQLSYSSCYYRSPSNTNSPMQWQRIGTSNRNQRWIPSQIREGMFKEMCQMSKQQGRIGTG